MGECWTRGGCKHVRGTADLVRLQVQVVVGALCGQADAIEAVHMHGGGLG